ncbi:MAG: flagellar biosynthesis protein [Oscillospiraceae bacterium]|nr:flagellar biosynthesis protein [Oscillospiraceae bacterium]
MAEVFNDINSLRLGRINNAPNLNPGRISNTGRKDATTANFGTILKEQLDKNSKLQFSKHAQERIGQRGIDVSETLMDSLEKAVSKARDKGARDVVIFDATNAFIVNIPNNMVITTMGGNDMKENIFTNIDSAVMI